MLKEYTVVKALKQLSDKVEKGNIGTILIVYNNPSNAYEVEFVDNEGNHLETLTVNESDIEI